MPIVCGIKFRDSNKVYYFAPDQLSDLNKDDPVIVETSRGREMGQVAIAPTEVPQDKIVGQLKPVLRRASPLDLLDAQRYQQMEAQVVSTCKELARRMNLPMKIVSAEYNYDGTRLTIFFSSEQRVDFRELVRELAHSYKTRIELRQIGVRDEAKIIGGVGKCGRPLCCATWLPDFCPVSIRMAKQQDLPLTPMEISGVCGRLLCCLEYENAYYQQIKGKFPKVGKIAETPFGVGKVVRVSVLRETVTLLMEDGSTLELNADQLAGRAPLQADEGLEQGFQVEEWSELPSVAEAAADTAKPVSEQARRDDSSRRRRGKRPVGPSERPSDSSGPRSRESDVASPAGPRESSGRRRKKRRTPQADAATSGAAPSPAGDGVEREVAGKGEKPSQPSRSSRNRRRRRPGRRPEGSDGRRGPLTEQDED